MAGKHEPGGLGDQGLLKNKSSYWASHSHHWKDNKAVVQSNFGKKEDVVRKDTRGDTTSDGG